MYTIGISGKARSGKDTAADMLFPLLPSLHLGDWRRVAFADKVKEVICTVFGVDLNFIEEWKIREDIPPGFEMTMRSALINVGDRLREIKSDCWVQLPLRLRQHRLITDVRYSNEAHAVYDVGFVIRVLSERSPSIENISETSLDYYDQKCYIGERPTGPIDLPGIPYDYIIHNDGSLKDLEFEVTRNLFPYLEAGLKKISRNT